MSGFTTTDFPESIEDWTKEKVRQWLLSNLRVPKEYADILYREDISGASLVCFEKQDLLDLGLTHGPAVQIIKHVRRFKDSSEKPVKQSERVDGNQTKSPETQEIKRGSVTQTESSAEIPSKPVAIPSELSRCLPRPFDKSSELHTYRQNDILPPETGPSNLLEPLHEYKLLANTENATEAEVLRKFCDEVLRFAAACMNSRTNGTIHFGVGDAPKYAHGQIIGIKVPSPQKFIDELDQNLQVCFEESTNVARICIRPPKFVQVLNPDDTSSNRCIVEVDIVPNFSETQENVFYTNMITRDKQGKKMKEQCCFVRQGASSLDVLKNKNRMKSLIDDVKSWASARKATEEKYSLDQKKSNQGQRLKQLITHGRDTLTNSFYNIVVTNKCPSSQLEHLIFLKEIKLFAVLEFDPESANNGSCSFFCKDRIANLHYPWMYNTSDTIPTIIENLNLFKQPSWVFCNGQGKEESEDDKPLDSSGWLKKRAGEVSDMLKFMCNPEVLRTNRMQVIFLLHSVIESLSSPLLETFCMMYQKLGGVENILCICRDESVFSRWRDLVRTRCEIDITSKCIYELSLNEVNCTIMKMKEPETLSSSRYLPSFGASSVLLSRKDEELLTVLEILCENECENTEIESSDHFQEFKSKTEEDFYRGGKVTWWNFYLSEKPGCLPFIKRDKYEELYNLITPVEGHKAPCVIINLFHHPGCGGTTLAMHVLWNLRRKFRCAVLKNNTAQNSEIATQVTQLLTYGKEEQTTYTPVLLLVDDLEDVEDLHRSILLAADEKRNGVNLMVIILNCRRSQFPNDSSRNSRIDNVFITNKLSVQEQSFFQQKLRELKDHHEKPETFYAFMIMTNNFSEKYIEDLVRNILKDLEVSSKVGQLLSFLALLNTFVNGSSMSLSLCEEFVGIKNALWGQETLEEKMNPYSTLLICFYAEEYGTYQAVRFLHRMIADKCLQVLIGKHNLKLSEITTNLLHCDLLYKSGMGKDILVQNIQSMLITRQRIEQGDDKNTLFSPLVEEMKRKEGTSQIKEGLIEATKRFDKNATIPQALARHFYLTEKDFQSALYWAHDAQQKNAKNSYIADTLGQVYKSHLKYEIELAEKQSKVLTPEDLEKYMILASKATKAFQDSQDLADKDESFDSPDQRNKKRQRTYNTSGYVGEIEVAMIIFDILQDIPFFNKTDQMNQQKMLNFLKNTLPVSELHENKANEEFIAVLKTNEKFLVSLKPRVKEGFVFFENFFTYLKPRSIERETAEDRNKRKVSEHFKKYVKIFCTSEGERESERTSQPKLSLQQKIEDARQYLEEKRADTFAGILQCLNDRSGTEMEKIFRKHEFIFENSTRKTLMNRTNFILSNIVLHCIKTSSKLPKRYNELITVLNEALQEEGIHSKCAELYFLAMLLLWPRRDNTMEEMKTSKNICTYVSSIKKSFHRRFSHLFHARSAIAHFYLGKSKGLMRIVHRRKLEHTVNKEDHISSRLLWQSGGIWKEPGVEDLLLRVKGKTENGEIYVHYPGNLKIAVRPAYLGGVRSGYSMEEVSFYLGFSMEGPIAYDIKYLNDL
ncbi:hypothetical protein JZ751_006228 [Albula glossodonta]|uniref:SAM domain-containing protein n=1 Tax=Albula glossodonta TaxID=121402 RepID=A0A8T2MY07_9TELE|nr:hypothetical protein JZ751_006228 [Albula glossodonta]